MRKLFLAVFLAATLIFTVSPAWSLPLEDTLLLKTEEHIHPYSDEAAKGVFADYLGITTADLDLCYDYIRIDGLSGKTNYSYEPFFSWDFALVKVDGPNDFSYLFMDDNGTNDLAFGDDILTTGMTFDFDVSNISFITKRAAVPEPATSLLLGLGFLGLAASYRKKLLKK